MATDSLVLRLELQRMGERVQGRLGIEDGQSLFFSGWLELIAAVEAARRAGIRAADEAPAPRLAR